MRRRAKKSVRPRREDPVGVVSECGGPLPLSNDTEGIRRGRNPQGSSLMDRALVRSAKRQRTAVVQSLQVLTVGVEAGIYPWEAGAPG